MRKKTSFILVAGLFISAGIKAQDHEEIKAMPLFQSDKILELSLKADYKEVFSNKDDSTFFPAEMTLTDNDGQEMTIDVKVRARGNVRGKSEICSFAPLRLEFPKKETKNTPFEGQKAIKLVTHCNKGEAFEQNTIEEYLIYRIYNILTDSSFRVRPVMINYIFTNKNGDTTRRFAFFIEREKFLAERIMGKEMETERIHPDRIDPYQTCLVDMFEYMIGNTDYSIYELHNMIIVADPANISRPFPVPYDFDWSGLVSASYAVPYPEIGTRYVTERVYRGLKKPPEVVDRVIRRFNDRKNEIYGVFENYPLLDESGKKRILNYLDEFYAIISSERMVKTEFFDKARTADD